MKGLRDLWCSPRLPRSEIFATSLGKIKGDTPFCRMLRYATGWVCFLRWRRCTHSIANAGSVVGRSKGRLIRLDAV